MFRKEAVETIDHSVLDPNSLNAFPQGVNDVYKEARCRGLKPEVIIFDTLRGGFTPIDHIDGLEIPDDKQVKLGFIGSSGKMIYVPYPNSDYEVLVQFRRDNHPMTIFRQRLGYLASRISYALKGVI